MNYTDLTTDYENSHKNDMETVGRTQKIQSNPLNNVAENTCFRGF